MLSGPMNRLVGHARSSYFWPSVFQSTVAINTNLFFQISFSRGGGDPRRPRCRPHRVRSAGLNRGLKSVSSCSVSECFAFISMLAFSFIITWNTYLVSVLPDVEGVCVSLASVSRALQSQNMSCDFLHICVNLNLHYPKDERCDTTCNTTGMSHFALLAG